MESGDDGHALALIRPVVHALLPPGLGQRFIAEPCPCLADEFHGVQGCLAALARDAIQRRDLLPETPIRPHFARTQQHIHMGVVGHPVDSQVHPDAEGIRQPLREPFRQRGFLDAAEASRQGRIQRPRRHRVSPPVMGFHAIPECFPLNRGTPAGQDQRQRGHVLLAAVVRRDPDPLIRHPGRGTVRGCEDR